MTNISPLKTGDGSQETTHRSFPAHPNVAEYWYMYPLNVGLSGYDKDLIDFDFWCFNATFNNISAISWRPVLVVEEARIPGENHRPLASNW